MKGTVTGAELEECGKWSRENQTKFATVYVHSLSCCCEAQRSHTLGCGTPSLGHSPHQELRTPVVASVYTLAHQGSHSFGYGVHTHSTYISPRNTFFQEPQYVLVSRVPHT